MMCGSELKSLPESVQRVAVALQAAGHPHGPVMLDDAARTAQQAADALGVGVGQIAKSIIFRRRSDDEAVLVITSGDRRVDEKKVEALVGKVGRADADFVRLKNRVCDRGRFADRPRQPAGDADRPGTVPV
jgi:prolyl-tRNA editing enzyme YbaK/EbsC (Cys-tRNA(Pro) deacylase)